MRPHFSGDRLAGDDADIAIGLFTDLAGSACLGDHWISALLGVCWRDREQSRHNQERCEQQVWDEFRDLRFGLGAFHGRLS